MRLALLLVTVSLAVLASAACSGGSGGGSGRLNGTIVAADDNDPIPGATIVVGSRTFTSDSSGLFGPADLDTRLYDMVASKPGFHTIDSNVAVESGENHLRIEMPRCVLPFDAGIAGCTPTPTGSPTAIPRATPNAFLLFDGENFPNDNAFVPWTGDARLNPGAERIIGDNGAGFDETVSECWTNTSDSFAAFDGSRTNAGTNFSNVDHCVIRWYGDGDGVNEPDAMVELRVTDRTLWLDGTRLDVSDPSVDVAYYEGTIGGNIAFSVTSTYVATTGSILLIDAGFFNDGSAAGLVVTSAAGFVIPNLP